MAHCAGLGLIGICWDLAVSAHEFYSIRGYFDDWHATHMLALDACRRAGDQRGEGIVLACLAQPALIASRQADAAQAMAGVERAARLLTACGDTHGQAIARRTLANALYRQGHLTRTLAEFELALACYEAVGDTGAGRTSRRSRQPGRHRGCRACMGADRRVVQRRRHPGRGPHLPPPLSSGDCGGVAPPSAVPAPRRVSHPPAAPREPPLI